jgi:hypothetical protein
MIAIAFRRSLVPLLLSVAAGVAACARARTIPGGCETVVAAPSVSVIRLTDSSPPRLSVAVTAPFPAHKPLTGVQVALYGDTVESRATTPMRSGATDAGGHLDLQAVPAGRYGMRARGAGAEPFFAVVGLRAAPSDSLEIRLVTEVQICY